MTAAPADPAASGPQHHGNNLVEAEPMAPATRFRRHPPPPIPEARAGPAPHPALRWLERALWLLVPPGYGVLALCFGQDANWDLLNYHWYNAYALLTGRIDWDLTPAQIPTFYNPAIDVPFYLANQVMAPRAVAFLLGSVQGLNFCLLYALALRVLRPGRPGLRLLTATGLALTGLLGGGALGLLATTFYDNILSLGLFASLLAIIAWWPRLTGRRFTAALGRAILCGLPVGCAMGLKQPNVVYSLALCATVLLVPGSIPDRLRATVGFGLGVLLGVALFSGSWMGHLWVHYRNPLFPYMNNVFGSPFAAPSDYRDPWFLPQNSGELLGYAFKSAFDPLRIGEAWFRDIKIPLLAMALPGALLLTACRHRAPPPRLTEPIASRLVLGAIAFSFLVWLKMFAIYRYLIPIEMIAPLGLVVALDHLPLRAARRGAVMAVILITAQLAVSPADWGRVPWSDHWITLRPPTIADPDHTMMLMGGYWATSFVLPFLPRQMPVVRLESSFAQPGSNNRFTELIRQRITAHDGAFAMLSTIPDTASAATAAAAYGLMLDATACQVIENNMGEPLNFCTVRRRSME
ncbi:MAG: hypothetical protein P4M00_21120 [Azospirillaceae bacterium]|nr:hypothetical protein [Azospirillaceae bacterium]